ncbi:polysaccharide pyruvyl transferase family protein [Methylobacillus arboreus]|uniref:polysaccharide pyruvyl transferase family protein n=1 Tax=Methylobacillus arboreus TaxID=755170 RepID=UPI001E640A18|nr:polysaccharide pyruvyl transferase family protein [Methylobacillus arboreus]MCB5189219.1 polysaccharide pyruvyl transferase family protein [Methylobacillus arboreus]
MAGVKNKLKSIRNYLQVVSMRPYQPQLSSNSLEPSILFLPAADAGGIGDDAMISGALNGVAQRQTHQHSTAVGRYSAAQSIYNFEHTLHEEFFWTQWGGIKQAEKVFSRYSHFYVMGADVMDGLYSYSDSIRRLRYAELARDMGLKVSFLGFSFNKNPHPLITNEIARIGKGIHYCLRDPISYDRFAKIGNLDMSLVADLAFLVKPNETTNKLRGLEDFVKKNHDKNKLIIGLNIHLLFNKTNGSGHVDKLVTSLASIIRNHPDIAFVLLPHDFRPGVDDRVPLADIAKQVASPESVYLLDVPLYASEIKKAVSYLDGLFTGRMHLGIAALGQGVPIAGIVYQGKFEGLFQHFGFSDGETISPAAAAEIDTVNDFFDQWLSRLPAATKVVKDKVPEVQKLSLKNFEYL